MSFLLKIVEGPNKGAEIALVDGVAVTLGKGDDCDIVLADPTMPAEPLSIEAGPDGVRAGDEPLEPFHVKTLGATSIAVGPADAQWDELQWPAREGEAPKDDGQKEEASPSDPTSPASPAGTDNPPAAPDAENPGARPSRPRRRIGLLVALALLLLALALTIRFAVSRLSGASGDSGPAGATTEAGTSQFEAIVARHGLALDDGKVTGNFATRRERLVATAELFAEQPGLALDLSDDESLRTAAEDTLALLSEDGLRVAAATNRVVELSGNARNIRRVMEALAADLPKLREVDVSGVSLASAGASGAASADGVPAADAAAPARTDARADGSAAQRSLPVCGILTAPYPCLVLRSGARILEGAPLGDGVVLKIEADSVTITNSTGVFTWKP